MADRIDELLALIDSGQAQAEAPLSLPEKLLGYSRSYLAGPTFNFEDELEAGIATAVENPSYLFSPSSILTSPEYSQELDSIRSQQERFKDKTDYLDNAVEIGSSILLNPLDKAGKLIRGANAGLTTLGRAATNPITQGVIAGVGAADGEDVVKSGLKGGVFGTAGSALGSVFGSAMQKAGRNADRLKLSAFGITQADINRQIKKLGDAAPSKADDIPILKTLEKAESQGIISVDNDVLGNMSGILGEQSNVSRELENVLSTANKTVPADPFFNAPNAMYFVNSLSGTARDKALKKFVEEYAAITNQLGKGTLSDLQKAKVGLNYAYEKDAIGESLIKSLREDLKEAIEKRVDDAAKQNFITPGLQGEVKTLNARWGNLAELKDAFAKRAGRDLGGDVIEDIFQGARTTGGMGTANLAGAQTESLILPAVGAVLNVARTSAGKNVLADTLREFQVPLQKAGKVLLGEGAPAPITARSSVEIADALGGFEDKQKQPSSKIDELLSIIDSAQSGTNDRIGSGKGSDSSYENLTKSPQAQSGKRSSSEDYSISPVSLGDLQNSYDFGNDAPTSDPTQAAFELLKSNFNGGTMNQDVDVDQLVRAVISQESRGNANAVSPKGAQGLMQVMPATAKEIAQELGIERYDLKNPETNRMFGTYYLNKMMRQFRDPELALAAYNAGPGRVKGWMDKYDTNNWSEIAARLKKAGMFSETVNYVPQVLKRMETIEV